MYFFQSNANLNIRKGNKINQSMVDYFVTRSDITAIFIIKY